MLGVYIGPGPDAGSFLERAADALAELGARPHWGKESAMRYRHSHPRLAAFEQLRSRWDPRDRFGGSIL